VVGADGEGPRDGGLEAAPRIQSAPHASADPGSGLRATTPSRRTPDASADLGSGPLVAMVSRRAPPVSYRPRERSAPRRILWRADGGTPARKH
jgi:hypothetical protein